MHPRRCGVGSCAECAAAHAPRCCYLRECAGRGAQVQCAGQCVARAPRWILFYARGSSATRCAQRHKVHRRMIERGDLAPCPCPCMLYHANLDANLAVSCRACLLCERVVFIKFFWSRAAGQVGRSLRRRLRGSRLLCSFWYLCLHAGARTLSVCFPFFVLCLSGKSNAGQLSL